MAPGPGKRKRGSGYDDGGSRPSPYRPGSSGMAQHGYGGPPHGGYHDSRRGGLRRGSGRGRGGGPRHSDVPNGSFNQRRDSQSNQQASRPPSQQSQTHPDTAAVEQEQQQQQQQQATPQPVIVEPVQQPAPPVDPYAAAAAMIFPEPASPPADYFYEYLSDDIARTWKQEGRDSLLATATKLRKDEDNMALGSLYQELLRAGLDGKVPPADVGAFVKDVLAVEIDSTDEMDQSEYSIAPASEFLDLASTSLREQDVKNPRLAAILMASEISQDTMRAELDSDLLAALNLVRSSFSKAFIRYQTNVLYRQSNYNLLREETEGYSKLMTELFTASTTQAPSAEMVKSTFERVRSMIGTFDLDVGRVLDVSLDVFAAVLIKHNRFFVKFLRCSTWWPSDQTDGTGSPDLPFWISPDAHGMATAPEADQISLAEARRARDTRFWELARQLLAKGKGLEAFFHLRNLHAKFSVEANVNDSKDDPSGWIAATGTPPPVGNKAAAQILGFKLRFYSSDARDARDELPTNLVHLAALLIKIGFISLYDLYPHLWPTDDKMDDLRKEKEAEHEKSKESAKPGGGQNALTRAGALSDDTAPPVRTRDVDTKAAAKADAVPEATEKKPKDDLPKPTETKITMLCALLAIGAIPEALFMLGRFPWILKLVPKVAEHIHRLIAHSIESLYGTLRPLQNVPELSLPAVVADQDQSGVAKGNLRRTEENPPRVLKWPKLDRYYPDENIQYRFYWEDWSGNMPSCQSIDDLFTLCDTFVNLSGVKIGKDAALLSKLYRIGLHSLDTDPSDSNKQRWIALCKKLLVPALSLVGDNSAVVSEAYELLKRFSTAARYELYSEWFIGPTSRLDDIRDAFAITRAQTQDILKKISKTNARSMARSLAKCATPSPGVVFEVAIRQMENYSNLVEVVVECARYFTALGYDVLTWSTLTALGRPRNRQSADGMFASKWLIALSSFFGKVYWRYALMNLGPTLQYLSHQLYEGNASDLKVFEDLLLNMGGIRPDITLNDAQIVAMAGGPLLQKEILQTFQDNRFTSRPTARRLMRALVDTKLVGPFVVAIAQERQTQLFKLGKDEDAPLKLLGNAFDEMHQILVQYMEFLRDSLNPSDFDRFVPSLEKLIGQYGLEPRIAFWICRASIVAKMEDADKSQADAKAKALQAPTSDATIDGEEKNTTDADVEMTDSAIVDTQIEAQVTENMGSAAWHPVLKELMDKVRTALDCEDIEPVGELFYITFWQLSHNDLFVPQESYKAEETKINSKSKTISLDRSDTTVAGSKKRQEQRASLNIQKEQLQAELKDQVSTYARFTRSRIATEKEEWFAHAPGKHDALNTALLEQCFIPRMVLSQCDSYYCFRMLKLLHSNGAKNFRTMGFLDQFFNQKRLASLFFMCTLKEAENMAVFINEILKDLSRWHAKKETYESEAWGARKDLPGFCKKLGSDKGDYVFLNYEDEFKRLLFKWHGQLANAIRQCLEGGEYMHIRNAITVLRGIVKIFPVVDMQAKKLVETVTNLGKTETRDDLKLAAQSLLGELSRRERNKEWVPLSSFYPTKNPPQATQAATAPAQTLNAAAPDFKPARLNGAKLAEYEDGEINSPTVAEAPKDATTKAADAKTTLPASAAAHTAPSAAAPTGKAAADAASASRQEGTAGHRGDSRSERRSSPAPGAARLESGRPVNGVARPPHNLPVRPENGPPGGRRSDRGQRDERIPFSRDGRPARDDANYYENPRRDRLADPRSRMPERPHDRGGERPPPSERDRPDSMRRGDLLGDRRLPHEERAPRPAARPERPERSDRTERSDRPSRDPRDHGGEAHSRLDASRERPATEANMPPPAPAVNPDRLRIIQSDAQSSGRDDRSARDSSRGGSQRNSRHSSPTRRDDRDHRPSHRDERAPYPAEPRGERPHMDDRRGPRGEAYIGHDDRSRGSHRSGPSPIEAPYSSRPAREHGPPPGESQYGRLNGPEAPTGPRGNAAPPPSRPGGRAPAGPAAVAPTSSDRPGDRPAPSGPASSRIPPRLQPTSTGRSGPGSSPGTPVIDSPASGVHPERARQIQNQNGPAAGPVSPSTAPRGPAAGAPTGPTRPSLGTPQSGPSTPVYDSRRGDKRFANLNNTLQQTGGSQGRLETGTSIRGRGGRNNPPQSPLGPGPTPPSGPGGPGRHDAGAVRAEAVHPSRADLFATPEASGHRGPPESGDQRGSRSHRSASPTRRGDPRPVATGPEDMRPPPRRMDSRDSRSRDTPPHPPGPSGPMPDRERRGGPRDGPRDDYGSGRRHGGGERRGDSRDIQWGGERSESRRDGGMPPDGPGSGRKRPGEHDDHNNRDPKRNRRGHRQA